MDPNVTLSDIRKICSDWAELDITGVDPATALDELVDLVYDLDAWLSSGGFRPDDWS